jgi:putative cell wall-binding protein
MFRNHVSAHTESGVMMMRSRTQKTIWLLVLLLVCSHVVLPFQTGAFASPRVTRAVVDPILWSEEPYTSGMADVIVMFSQQAPVSKVVRSQIMTGSPHADLIKAQTRRLVVAALMETSQASMTAINPILKRYLRQGLIADVAPLYIINAVKMKATRDAIDKLADHPLIQYICHDAIMTLDEPADMEEMVTLAATGWNLQSVAAPHVWDVYGLRGDGVVIGVIDTGVDWTHPALRSKFRGYDPEHPLVPNLTYNWFDTIQPGSVAPVDSASHGTHVTGILVGEDVSQGIITGVAPDAKWIAARVFSASLTATSSDIIAATQYMLAPTDAAGVPNPDMAPDIINGSFGRDVVLTDYEWFRYMVQHLIAAEILPVFAAGNNGTSKTYNVQTPAAYPESIAVAAVDDQHKLATFSSRGPGVYSSDEKPDLSAPGVNVNSTLPGGGYGQKSGTSMATPHVAGVAALILSFDPSLGVAAVRGILEGTALPLMDATYPFSPNAGYGFGLVNAKHAMEGLTIGYFDYRVIDGEAYVLHYIGPGGDVVIPDQLGGAPVIWISGMADKGLTQVTIPDTVRFLGDWAFGKNQLTSVTLPAGLEVMGYGCFHSNLLQEIQLPLGLTEICENTFMYNQLTTIQIPDGVTAIGAYAFLYNNLTTLWVPDSVQTIDRCAFYGNQLTSVRLPNNLKVLSEAVFYKNQLASIQIPASVTHMDDYALAKNLFTEILIRPTVIYMSQEPFERSITIRGKPGSYAETFASRYRYPFISMDCVITVNRNPVEGGSISGAGTYEYGNDVIVGAQPKTGWRWDGWYEGGVLQSTALSYQWTVTHNRTLEARFSRLAYTISGGASPGDAGTVTGSGTYLHGDLVQLQLNPTGDYRFRYWLEGSQGLSWGNPASFSATSSRTIWGVAGPAIQGTRLSGANRYLTAVAISQAGWDEADTVIIARGDHYADALAGVPLAAMVDAPILLTPTAVLSAATGEEILRLGARHAIILGGVGAVSEEVVTMLQDRGLSVERIAGTNRYDTAGKIALRMTEAGSVADTAMIVVGSNFPDAVSAAAYAARDGMPILLVTKDSIPEATQTALQALQIKDVIVAGGDAVIAASVFNGLPNQGSSCRIGGSNRYETSVNMARFFNPTAQHVIIATGLDFPDAITGGVLAAKMGTGVMLVPGTGSMPSLAVRMYLVEAQVTGVTLLGGSTVVSSAMMTWF